jgi:predicted alpha/beta superfamily hydrolase
MTKKRKNYIVTTILFSLTLLGVVYGQNNNNKQTISINLVSNILSENRNILIHLPANYENSNLSYPVIYRLDGDAKLLRKTASTISKLSNEKDNVPEMIIVAIENTNRSRDMWPTHTKYYPESQPLGSKGFLEFIEKELIPNIESNYRTNENRIIVGQSLSAVFTLYIFLTKPYLFDSYIASSGAFPDCEPYFKELSNKAFQQIDQYEGKKIFITHGLKDELDKDGIVHQQMIDFSISLNNNLGNKISCEYLFYENAGHVPKNSLQDGLEYLF